MSLHLFGFISVILSLWKGDTRGLLSHRRAVDILLLADSSVLVFLLFQCCCGHADPVSRCMCVTVPYELRRRRVVL